MRWLAMLSLGCTTTLEAPLPTDDTSPEPVVEPEVKSIAEFGIDGFVDGEIVYADGAIPYRLATPLFSDYALKERAIFLPDGGRAQYDGTAVLDFPVGTVILKSFLFPADFRQPDEDVRIIETRVLVHEEGGWNTWPYLWNDDQTDAVRASSGAVLDIDFIDADGNAVSTPYLVPQRNQCVDCHELVVDGQRSKVPIGPKVRNLLVGDQDLTWLETIAEGVPEGITPAVDADAYPDGPVSEWDPAFAEVAARDYLDVNCAHCHNPDGVEGVSSQLFLNFDNEDEFRLGVCKKPGSAGRGTGGLTYDIVPGEPEQSIMWYRTQTVEVGEMMPDIGRALRHDIGVELVEVWIAGLEGTCEEDPDPAP
ncbi:MAG: SO2930 family diheme c-type cytochrome [Myxococcota bacterium]